MRVAALYDIHGNLPAVDAVLAELAALEIDRLVVGGDVVPGPLPALTLDRLLSLDYAVDFIAGNGESDVLEAASGGALERVPAAFRGLVGWNAERLTDERLEQVRAWPPTVTLDVPGVGRVLFCHATPHSDNDLITERSPDARLEKIFAGVEADVVVLGHTHVPFDRLVGRVRVVNAGSVGMPFGRPGAAWLLLGPEIEPRHTLYGLNEAGARIRASGYPQAEPFARSLAEPPSADSMIATFEEASTATFGSPHRE